MLRKISWKLGLEMADDRRVDLDDSWILGWFKNFLFADFLTFLFGSANGWSMAGQLLPSYLRLVYFGGTFGVTENILAFNCFSTFASIVAVLPLTIGGVGLGN